MKRSTNRKRHRPEEVVAKLRQADERQADEALAKGTPIAEVARSIGGVRGHAAPLADRVRGGGPGRGEAAEGSREGDRQGGILSPARRRRAIGHVKMLRDVSKRRVCRVAGQHRSTQRRPVPPNPYRDRLWRGCGSSPSITRAVATATS